MSAPTLDDVLANDRASLDAAILDEEIEFRERIIELKSITYEKRKKRRVKAENKVRKLSHHGNLSDIYKMSNNLMGSNINPNEEVTKKTFDERCKLFQQKSESVDDEIKNGQVNCDLLTYSFRNACKILFQLSRLEMCCTKMEMWAAGLRNTTAVDDTPLAQEELVAEHIRGLLGKRDEELGRIEVLKNKLNTATESIKYASIKTNCESPENASSNERSLCPIESGNDSDMDPHHLITNATKRANDRLTLLRQRNNDLYIKIKGVKISTKRDVEKLEVEKTKEERGTHIDFRAIAELSKGNAVITSNLESLMQQLNFEHYGLGGGPSSRQACHQKELAISERRTAISEQRAKSKSNPGSQPKEEASSVHEAGYCTNGKGSPQPEIPYYHHE